MVKIMINYNKLKYVRKLFYLFVLGDIKIGTRIVPILKSIGTKIITRS